MAEFFDRIPWLVYPLMAGGLGTAAIFLIPGALPFSIGVWNALPKWLRLTIIFVASLGLAVLYGRNQGARNAREAQAKRDAAAVGNRKDTNREVQNLDRPAADKRLDRWMRD